MPILGAKFHESKMSAYYEAIGASGTVAFHLDDDEGFGELQAIFGGIRRKFQIQDVEAAELVISVLQEALNDRIEKV